MRAKTDIRSMLRREWRSACDNYWRSITRDYEDAQRLAAAREVAAISVRLHIFEQGRRSRR